MLGVMFPTSNYFGQVNGIALIPITLDMKRGILMLRKRMTELSSGQIIERSYSLDKPISKKKLAEIAVEIEVNRQTHLAFYSRRSIELKCDRCYITIGYTFEIDSCVAYFFCNKCGTRR